MSALGSNMSTCPAMQVELNKYFGPGCDPALMGFPSPFADFLMSPQNRSGIQQELNPKAGRVREVIVRYDQKLAPAPLGTYSEDISCVAQDERGDLTTSYNLDTERVVFRQEKMNVDNWEQTCRSNPEIIMRKLALLMQSVREGTYRDLARQFVANAMWGKWGKIPTADTAHFTINGQDQLVVKTHKDNSIDLYPTTLQTIKNALIQTNACVNPFYVGGYSLPAYAELMQAGCCTDSGFGLDKIFAKFGAAFAWDKWLAQAFNDTNLTAAIQSGALQLVWYNKYDSTKEVDLALSLTGGGKNYQKMVITDPVSGFPMNLLISDNCGNISIFLHTNIGLLDMPADMFAVGDDLEGSTFVNLIKVVNVG
jgi:hypothetical protein